MMPIMSSFDRRRRCSSQAKMVLRLDSFLLDPRDEKMAVRDRNDMERRWIRESESRLAPDEKIYLFFWSNQCCRWQRSDVNRPEAQCRLSISKVESWWADRITSLEAVQRWSEWIASFNSVDFVRDTPSEWQIKEIRFWSGLKRPG